jgi:hypothetical protein
VDNFMAYPTYAVLSGNAFYNRVNAFESVVAISAAGSSDLASLYDSAGDDLLVADAATAVLSDAVATYSNRATGFRYVTAYGSAGGKNTARLTNAADKGTFLATPTYATMLGAKATQKVRQFQEVQATSPGGAAKLYDSPGNDKFLAYPEYAVLSGTNFSNRADGFRTVTAYASQGKDAAQLFDNAAAVDSLVATPSYAALSGAAYYNRANGFDSVEGNSRGGLDSASFYDSIAVDTFTAYPAWASMTNAAGSFLNRGNGFAYVSAFSSRGPDVANLFGAAGNDVFTGTPTYGQYAGEGYNVRANNFAQVNANAPSSGNNTAKLYDSAILSVLSGSGNHVKLAATDLRFALSGWNFKKVTATQTNPASSNNVASAVDYLLEVRRS